MRALVTDRSGPRLVERYEQPAVGPSEALVRVEAAGLSPMDIACATGRIAHTGVMGHEIVGVVEKLGERVSRSPLIGKRVVVSPDLACGACDLCRKGLSVHCRERRVIGLSGRDGGLAERVSVPARNLFPVPAGMALEWAVLASSVADAVHVAHLAPVEKQTYVTVLGDGAGAILAAQVLARRNASVRLVGARQERFGLCERWQIRHRHISEPGLRADQDVVVVCLEPEAGGNLSSAEALRTAIGMLRPRGTLALQGPRVPVQGLDVSLAEHLERVVRDELRVLGARSGRIAEGLEAIASGLVDLAPLVTRRARLDEGVGLLRAASSPEQIRTVVEIAA